jgi:autotransporter-associated beta strand protein
MKPKCSRLLLTASSAIICIGSAHAADGVFSSAAIGAGNNDANVGLSSSKTYFNAVNTEGGALTINGVSFEASAGPNPSGTGYTISGVPNTFPGPGGTNNVTGQLGSLVDNFIYNGTPAVFTLKGLTAGQTYSLTYYNRSWSGDRIQNITTTSGATTAFDQDSNTVGDLNLLRYTFTASGTSEVLNFAPQGAASMHIYGFSTEQTFNNTWTSGADWTTATWSGSVPNAVGANADFTSQGTPTSINLNAAQTVGHVRFAGTNAWTVSGANALTLQADVGAVSVLGATSGTHTISTALTLNSDVLKTGAGTVVLSGAVTDNGKNVTLGAGTLEIANASAQTMSGNISGGGNLAKSGAGTLTLTGSNTYSGATTINAGTLRFTDTAPNSSASLSIASGATLEFNVSTAPTPSDGAHVQLGAVGGTTVTGTGTFVKSGAGVLALDGQGGNHAVTFNMTGGLIDIQGGTLRNGGWGGGIWGSNLASMNVATGAMFDLWGGQSVVVDALTGGGTVDSTSFGDTQTLTVGANNSSGTFSGVFQNTTGSLGLIKTGSGTQTLTGANTYTGATTVSAGTLKLTNTTNGATGTLAVGSSITVNSGGTLLGSGFNALGHSSTHAGDLLTINKGGTLLVDAGTVLSMPYALNVVGGTIASVDGGHPDFGTIYYASTSGTFTSAIDGTAATISAQNFNLQGAQFNVVQGGGAVDLNVTGNLTGVALVKNGNGTMVLSNANTYTGATTINGGTLKLQGTAFSTTARAYSIASGAVLNLDGGAGVASGNTTISGTGTLRISGGGLISGADGNDLTLELGSGALIDIQSGASMYNGGWQNMTWTSNLASLQVDGTFDMGDGNNLFADALTGSGTVAVSGSDYYTLNQSITVGVNGGGGTFSGNIVDSGGDDDTVSLIKTGGGTQILTGTNNYVGNTTVNGGTLIINGNISTSSLTTVQSGGTLGGSGAVGSLTVDSGGFLNPGNSPGILSVDGDYIQLGTVNIEIAGITAGSQHDQVNVDRASGDGAVNLSGNLVTAFSGGSYANGDLLFILLNDASDAINGTFSGLAQDAIVTNYGGFDWKISYTADSTGNTFTGGNDIALMAVPEPSAAILSGLGMLALLRRRR